MKNIQETTDIGRLKFLEGSILSNLEKRERFSESQRYLLADDLQEVRERIKQLNNSNVDCSNSDNIPDVKP